jgi:hypothetical protein
MAGRQELDAARFARAARVTSVLFFWFCFAWPAPAQEFLSDGARQAAAQKAFDAGHWEEAASLARGPVNQPADLDFLAGLALARLQRWQEARAAFQTGREKVPRDPRFPVELAGIDYKQHNLSAARRELHAALKLDPRDNYTHDFVATLYFLDGNLEAALKYWNVVEKPRLRNVSVQPPPQLDEALLHRAIGFNAPQILTTDALLAANAQLSNLGIYPRRRLELIPGSGRSYDLTLHMPERDAWGDSRWEGTLSLLSGLPYATVYPEFYDLGHQAVNVTSLLRWDSEKRRAYGAVSTPILHDPKWNLRLYFDGRNENWNLTNTFFAPGAPLSDLNIRRIAGGAELRSIVNGLWNWRIGLEIANRSFGNLNGHTSPSEAPFFTDGNSLIYWARVDRSLLRVPERRFTLDGEAEVRVGREFAHGLDSFGGVRGSAKAHWFPQAKGDDYEMQGQLRGAEMQGDVPFDELFQLGIERDNDLWLRGHAGASHGRKGAAPLGRRYFLANWEMDKNVYGNGLLTIKLGPFVDNGAIADSSGLFGSQRWLWDTGAQCKIRLLGTLTVVLSYGRDLSGGRNVFYGTTLH